MPPNNVFSSKTVANKGNKQALMESEETTFAEYEEIFESSEKNILGPHPRKVLRKARHLLRQRGKKQFPRILIHYQRVQGEIMQLSLLHTHHILWMMNMKTMIIKVNLV